MKYFENLRELLKEDESIDKKTKYILLSLIDEVDDIDNEITSLTNKILNNKDFKYSFHRAKIEYIREKTKLFELIEKILKELREEKDMVENIENISDIFERK
ncbi:MAG: hypothetical protein N2749_02010 [Clostridia bacterium]|nr:hypothetical protein [Clostridia bacterium]